MKTVQSTLLLFLSVWMIACHKGETNTRTQMSLDAEISGSDVFVVKQKQAVRPVETVSDLRGLTNIMQYDLEAKERVLSKEVVYFKLGEPARPMEQKR